MKPPANRKILLPSLFLAYAISFAADNPIKVDNDLVRIINAVDMPHAPGARHRHEFNRVMVYLDGGNMTLTYDDGHKDEQHWKAGDVAWSPADGYHVSENVGSSPMHIVEIELKKPGPTAPPQRKPELDPVATDSKHNILLFENDQVRVFRSWRDPGDSETLHEHVGRGRAAVFLTDIDTRIKSADGGTDELHDRSGGIHWSDGSVKHFSTNIGKNKFEVIVVEVK